MIIILLGAPGAGKGTQAKNISEKLDMSHISTGDILRKEIRKETDLGLKAKDCVQNGKLVSDDLIMEIIKKEIQGEDAKAGFLLDGFPRNLNQAKLLDEMLGQLSLSIGKVINIAVEEDEIIRRLSARRLCPDCKQIVSAVPGEKEICPHCGEKLIKRDDDSTPVIKKRLEVYSRETEPLIDYYRQKGLLAEIDGCGSPDEITERVLQNI